LRAGKGAHELYAGMNYYQNREQEVRDYCTGGIKF